VQSPKEIEMSQHDHDLIRLPEVLRMTGLSKSSLYALMKQNRFVTGVKLSERSVAWPSWLVREWIDERIASSAPTATAKQRKQPNLVAA
jgi:prophage regulatory protein